jgi:HD-like signal output (HDOD) protein
MGFFEKIRRHSAVASGNFDAMFKKVEIPPLPMAVSRLLAEINQPEPDTDLLVNLISSETGIAAKVIKTVNSALFSLRMPVADVKRAVTVLGLQHIRSIALAFATMDSLPEPETRLFDHEAFWTDSLLRAIMARSFSKKLSGKQPEEAFTASLLADVALPVLLSAWTEYYEPVIAEWHDSPTRLSELERENFGWDHAQAGAWIVRSWDFPDEMVCYLGVHNLPMETIVEQGLNDTIVTPMALAALLPSVLKPDPKRSEQVCLAAAANLSLSTTEFVACVEEVKASFAELRELFGLHDLNTDRVFDDLLAAASQSNRGIEA